MFGPQKRLKIPMDIAEIEGASQGCTLVVIDPLRGFLNGDSRKQVREALTELEAMAARTGAAVLVVHHTGKNSDTPLGSQDIVGIPRSLLYVDHGTSGVLVLSQWKKNIAPSVANVHFRIVERAGVGAVEWVTEEVSGQEGDTDLTEEGQAEDTDLTEDRTESKTVAPIEGGLKPKPARKTRPVELKPEEKQLVSYGRIEPKPTRMSPKASKFEAETVRPLARVVPPVVEEPVEDAEALVTEAVEMPEVDVEHAPTVRHPRARMKRVLTEEQKAVLPRCPCCARVKQPVAQRCPECIFCKFDGKAWTPIGICPKVMVKTVRTLDPKKVEEERRKAAKKPFVPESREMKNFRPKTEPF